MLHGAIFSRLRQPFIGRDHLDVGLQWILLKCRKACATASARASDGVRARNAYSVARCASAYHGCMLEASRALKAASTFVFRELPSDIWTGCVRDWIKFIVIGVRAIALAITLVGVRLSLKQ
jgi:hypothetical protein